MFAGFDRNDFLCVASVSEASDTIRFVRIMTPSLAMLSDTAESGPVQHNAEAIVWSPLNRTVWSSNTDVDVVRHCRWQWTQYTEDGRETGKELCYRGQGVAHSAIALGQGGLLALFGNLTNAGNIVTYSDNRATELKVPCVPQSFGISNDLAYAGVICMTAPDRPGTRVVFSSDFFLIKTSGPSIVWTHPMRALAVADANKPMNRTGTQVSEPLIYRSGKKIWIVAVSKRPELTVNVLKLSD